MLRTCLVGCLLALVQGCQQAPSAKEFNTLKRDKIQLTRQNKQCRSENEQLKKQLQVLADLPNDVRLETLYNLQKI